MIMSAEEFVELRGSERQEEYLRAAGDTAKDEVWLEVIQRFQQINDTLRPALNRAFLVDGRDGSVYVILEFMPVVLKLDSEGRLVWQKRLENPSSSRLASIFWDPVLSKGVPRMVKNLDGSPRLRADCRRSNHMS